MQCIADQIAQGMTGEDTLGRAWSFLASLIGALNVLRACDSPAAFCSRTSVSEGYQT